MPKKTTVKSTKGTKASAKKSTVAKKTATSKKSTAVKKETVKATTKKAPAKEVKATKVEEKIMPKKKENKKERKITKIWNSIANNTPFAITLCIAISLLIALILSLTYLKVVPRVKNGDEILASLKGKNITAQSLYEELRSQYGNDKLINIIDSYIAEKEVKTTDEDKKYVDEVVDYYKQYAEYYGTDLATFLANYVGLKGVTTEKEFREYVLADYKKTLAVQKYIGNEASEKDLKKYYKENFSDTITAKHILVSIDAEAKDQEAAEKEALNKAKSLIKELKKTSKDKLVSKFESLAEENSDDTATYSKGGLIENFTKKDVEEAFFNAANDLKDGEYTKEPVKTSYGYHIILKESSTPVEKYSKIKDKVKKEYAQNLMNEVPTLSINKWKELRKKYKLSIKDTEMKKAYNNYVDEAIKNALTNKENAQKATEQANENTEK